MKHILYFFLLILPINLFSQTYVIQTSNTSQFLSKCFFKDSLNGYAAGDGGTILSTTNGGTLWNQMTLFTSTIFRDVRINAVKIFVVGTQSNIFSSTNNGQTWQSQILSPVVNLLHINFINSSTGFISTNNDVIFRTTNNGDSWTPVNTSTSAIISPIYFLNNTTGYCFANINQTIDSCVFLKTTDSGISWQKKSIDFQRMQIFHRRGQACWFVNADTGYSVHGYYTCSVLRTYNGGNSWHRIFDGNGYAGNFNDIRFFGNKGIIFSSLADGVPSYMLRSNNHGNSWEGWFNRFQLVGYLSSVYYVSNTLAYAVGSGGLILKINNFLENISTGMQNQNQIILSGNLIYPNPSNGLLYLPVRDEVSHELELIVNDILGREVYKTVIYGSSIDLRHLPKGTYFLIAKNSGKIINQQKIVLK